MVKKPHEPVKAFKIEVGAEPPFIELSFYEQ